MLLIGTRKIVGTREIFLGTHVEIVVADMIQHSVNATNAGYLDRARRQPLIPVGVIGRVDGQ